jgi:hypothetical protein
VVGVLGVLLLPPQPTANTKAEIKITKPILRTFPPLPYFLGIDALRDHSRDVSLPNIGARMAARVHYQVRLRHCQRRIARAPGLCASGVLRGLRKRRVAVAQ